MADLPLKPPAPHQRVAALDAYCSLLEGTHHASAEVDTADLRLLLELATAPLLTWPELRSVLHPSIAVEPNPSSRLHPDRYAARLTASVETTAFGADESAAVAAVTDKLTGDWNRRINHQDETSEVAA